MKTTRNCLLKLVLAIAAGCSVAAQAALPSGWQHTQELNLGAPGLAKISLPVATLDAARHTLEDLRIYDAAGNELPFVISRPAPTPKAVQGAKSFQVSLNASTTVITLETGLNRPLDGVALETSAMDFIKPVRVEGSMDGQSWQRLVQGQPIFRQPYGSAQLHIKLPTGTWRWLRLTIDDQRSQPVPFTGARIFAATAETTPMEWHPASITERDENPGETRLTLNLGAANLDVAAVQIESDDPLFTRAVTVAVPQVTEDSIREHVLGHGTIYRIALENQPSSAELDIPLETHVPSRDLVLLIRNEDSPPLHITGVRVARRPVYLTFLAPQPGTFQLLTGNKSCAAPRYDLSALSADLKSVAVQDAVVSSLTENPDYHPPEALAGLEITGSALDITPWKFRKLIQTVRNGAQQLELDPDVLAHAQAGFGDLRIMHGSNQIPYVIQRTSINRILSLPFTLSNDPKNLKLSRWLVKLPKANLPLTRLTCSTTTPLFQRTITVSEELADERGETYRRQLGSATWVQTPGRKTSEFSLSLESVPQNDTLILETENGDNPPVQLDQFRGFYPASRLLFKTTANDTLHLYYGNLNTDAPRYDLALVAGELLAAEKSVATMGAEETLKKSAQTQNWAPGTGGIVFWGILAIVVIGLLVVISKLLPKPPEPKAG